MKTIREEGLCHGVHVMAVGNERVVPDILEAAGLACVRA
jgi:5,10-methylenetetrahydrofolate reductase